MSGDPISIYAQWRTRHVATLVLREDDDSPPERLLQAVWQHQRLRRDELKTLDDRAVRVLHPGFGNVEGGPDFRGAVIQIGHDAPITGDVEVDVRASGWHAHGHDKNPNFKNVILHVVWDADSKNLRLATTSQKSGSIAKTKLPTLVLRGKLDASPGELSLWLENEPAKALPDSFRGKCSAPLRELNEGKLTTLLHEAAEVRFQSKAAQFKARARFGGWEQSLWEGLFRALGYKHNVWPMHNLAETRPRWAHDAELPVLQARLLGISGLLPAEVDGSRTADNSYIRRVWDFWWRERNEFEDCTLPRSVWRFHGLRPANHPQRRLALASHWICTGDFVSKLEHWCAADIAQNSLLASLSEILNIRRDDFWSWHWTIHSPKLAKPQPLLGEKRVTDLAVNVILPWLFARASEGKGGKLGNEIFRRYTSWPAAEDNSVLRLARERLLGGASKRLLRNAVMQQGLMQIVRDFCEHSNSVCDACPFPELIRARFQQAPV